MHACGAQASSAGQPLRCMWPIALSVASPLRPHVKVLAALCSLHRLLRVKVKQGRQTQARCECSVCERSAQRYGFNSTAAACSDSEVLRNCIQKQEARNKGRAEPQSAVAAVSELCASSVKQG